MIEDLYSSVWSWHRWDGLTQSVLSYTSAAHHSATGCGVDGVHGTAAIITALTQAVLLNAAYFMPKEATQTPSQSQEL